MPPTDTAIALLTQRVETMHNDFGDMKAVLQKLTDAVNTLALVEERQAQLAAALERSFKAVEKLEQRVSTLEQKAPDAARAGAWVDRAVFAALGLLATLAVRKIFGEGA